MELWQLKSSLVKCGSLQLIRLTHRAEEPIFNGKTFRDLDTNFQTDKEENHKKAQTFIANLGFKFPLPLGPSSAQRIFSLSDFPPYEAWVRFKGEEAYTIDDYKWDLSLWTRQRLLEKTHAELFRWFMLAIKRTERKSQGDRVSYEVQLIRRFYRELGRLDEFYLYNSRENVIRVPAPIVKILEAAHAANRKDLFSLPVSAQSGRLDSGQKEGDPWF